MQLDQVILILILNNSGGDGKSTWTEFLSCLARLAGLDPLVIDVDPGNHGFHLRGGVGLEFAWTTAIGSGAEAEAWFSAHLNGRRLVIVDTGANFLSLGAGAGSSGVEVVRTVGQIAHMVAAANGRVIVHAITSPNKPGSGELVKSIYDRFSGNFEVAVIRNNRDGSENFGDEIDSLPVEIVNVPQIEPGFQAYRLSRPEPLDQVLLRPGRGYSAATGALAQILRRVVEQPHVRSIVGTSADDALRSLSAHCPGPRALPVSTLLDARDEVLTANARFDRAWRRFLLRTPPAASWFDVLFVQSNWASVFRKVLLSRREFREASRDLWKAHLEWEEALDFVTRCGNEG